MIHPLGNNNIVMVSMPPWLTISGHMFSVFCFCALSLSPLSLFCLGGAHLRVPPLAHAPALIVTHAANPPVILSTT